ncbi:YhgE/Pip domain-containing protein [Bacillus sp. LLTC93]|uniref:YhgE/Pip domain-containing protein n=1 Tax=Bacillus sp. LLTC93 TaxID=2108274 RepID=UPI000D01FAE5|nr:YhgE/Pip domain-containing protein [Bacillus sp. LLTC93]PRO41240.1 YhgE/Pip domain-containing protein [Bacillus sp. LLTC93]
MNLIRNQWKDIVTSKKLLIPILAVLFIPLIYSGVFLKAYWDPYGTVDQLPVAVVNLDEGSHYDGKTLQVGDDLVKELKKNDSFKWHFVDSEEKAIKGLNNEDYYLVVEIPKDFSKNASTVLDKHPKKSNLKYYTNPGANYAASQIANNAIIKLKDSVSKEVTENYAEVIFDNFKTIAKGLDQASDGAKKIDDGTKSAKEGSQKLKDNLAKLAEGTLTYSEGVHQFAGKMGELNTGIQSLDSGLGQLLTGYQTIDQKFGELGSGIDTLSEGLNTSLEGHQQLASKMPQFTAGIEQLNNKAQSFSEKIAAVEKVLSSPELANLEKMAPKLDQVKTDAKAFNTKLASLKVKEALSNRDAKVKSIIQNSSMTDEEKKAAMDQLESLPKIELPDLSGLEQSLAALQELPDASEVQSAVASAKAQLQQVKQLPNKTEQLYTSTVAIQNAIDQMTSGTNKLYQGALKLQTGQGQLQEGLQTANGKLDTAKSGADKLANGSSQLSAALNKLESGSTSIQSNSSKLAEGSKSLDKGLGDLKSGTGKLSNKLKSAADETGEIDADQDNYNMIASPVKTENDTAKKIDNYGTGLTPYILSMGLFVGALMLTVVFPMKDPAGRPRNAFEWFVSKYSVLLLVGILQAVIASTMLIFGLGLEVESLWRFYLFAIVVSLTFLAIIQLLATTMGNPGRFIAVIILVLQLAASAGTFPLELVPKFFQVIHSLLPMTYTINGFRTIIASGDDSYLWHQAAVLGTVAIIMMAATTAYFAWNIRKMKQDEA